VEICFKIDKISDGNEKEPPHFSWQKTGAPCQNYRLESMLSETLRNPQLFFLLHKIDVDLAESSRGSGCPFVEGRCIVLHIFASLVAVLLVYLKNIVFV